MRAVGCARAVDNPICIQDEILRYRTIQAAIQDEELSAHDERTGSSPPDHGELPIAVGFKIKDNGSTSSGEQRMTFERCLHQILYNIIMCFEYCC